MKTTINIGTDKGSILGIEVEKCFNDITLSDIIEIATIAFDSIDELNIQSWADVTPEPKKEISCNTCRFDDPGIKTYYPCTSCKDCDKYESK